MIVENITAKMILDITRELKIPATLTKVKQILNDMVIMGTIV